MSKRIYLIDETSGVELRPGTEVNTFRGETVKVVNWTAPGVASRGGRVTVEDAEGEQRSYFPSVINATFVEG